MIQRETHFSSPADDLSQGCTDTTSSPHSHAGQQDDLVKHAPMVEPRPYMGPEDFTDG